LLRDAFGARLLLSRSKVGDRFRNELSRNREGMDPVTFARKPLDSRLRGNDGIHEADVTHVRNSKWLLDS
jgi:hypothetical protein